MKIINSLFIVCLSLGCMCSHVSAQVLLDSLENNVSQLGGFSFQSEDSLISPLRPLQPASDDPLALSLPFKTKEITLNIESLGKYDTNVFENVTELSDWHWDSTVQAKGKFVPFSDSGKVIPLEVGVTAGIGFGFYDQFSNTKDFSSLGGGVSLRYLLTPAKTFPAVTLVLSDAVTSAYRDWYDESAYFGNDTTFATEFLTVFSDTRRIGIQVSPSVVLKRFDVDSLNRQDFSLGANLFWKIGGPDVDHPQFECVLEAKGTFADYNDVDREYWKIDSSAAVAWNISGQCALVAKAAYANRDDSTRSGFLDYDQFVMSAGLKLKF